MAQRTAEQKAKHAEYMRRYYAEHPGYKAEQDAKHRKRYIEKLRSYDRTRSQTPERRTYQTEEARRRRSKNPEYYKSYHQKYYQQNKEKLKEQSKLRAQRMTPEQREMVTRWYAIKHKHGITKDQYAAMVESQNGLCAICGQPPNVGKNQRFHIDHDHATGVIRGLLCMFCNHAMERIDNVPGWPQKAFEYATRPR